MYICSGCTCLYFCNPVCFGQLHGIFSRSSHFYLNVFSCRRNRIFFLPNAEYSFPFLCYFDNLFQFSACEGYFSCTLGIGRILGNLEVQLFFRQSSCGNLLNPVSGSCHLKFHICIQTEVQCPSLGFNRVFLLCHDDCILLHLCHFYFFHGSAFLVCEQYLCTSRIIFIVCLHHESMYICSGRTCLYFCNPVCFGQLYGIFSRSSHFYLNIFSCRRNRIFLLLDAEYSFPFLCYFDNLFQFSACEGYFSCTLGIGRILGNLEVQLFFRQSSCGNLLNPVSGSCHLKFHICIQTEVQCPSLGFNRVFLLCHDDCILLHLRHFYFLFNAIILINKDNLCCACIVLSISRNCEKMRMRGESTGLRFRNPAISR